MNIPRNEYPRPQLARKDWLSLNGEWQFLKDFGVSGKQRNLFCADDSAFPEKITVPFCMESSLSGIGYTDFCECVWYRKRVDIPAAWRENGKRVLLNVGACDYLTDVYVNSRHAGSHRGGYVSFELDITDLICEGENVITICAEDKTRSCEQPAGKQSQRYESFGCFYTRTTGIWQSVWLESAGAEYIKSVKYDCNTEASALGITAKLFGGVGKTVKAEAFWQGKKVGEASTVASQSGVCTLTLPLSELHLWELGVGGLYDLVLTFGDDRVDSYFGMRSLKLDDSALVINGKKVFQRLILDQGFYPDGIYTAPTEEELIADITRSMACGFNGARLHQKVFEPLFLYHCDRLGYMVWGEHANWGLDISRPTAWKGFMAEWIEILERDMNHPAIIGWCPFNETQKNQDDDIISYCAELTKRIDPTRPVIDTSGWVHVNGATDIMDWHDYDQNPETFRQRYIDAANGTPVYDRRFAKEPLIPRFISEYGGIKWDVNSGLGNAWGYGKAPKTEEEFLDRFKGLAEALLFNKFITGLCYTQLTDVEQEINGLYTYDRKAKFDPDFFKAVLTQKAAVEE